MEHEKTVMRAEFSLDGTRVVSASSDETVRIWDAGNGRSLVEPLVHLGDVHCAAFSPDVNLVATACSSVEHGCYAQVWDARTGRPVTGRLQHVAAYLLHVAFSPDSKRIVSASSDQTARIWDATSGEPLTAPMRHDAPVQCASFSPGGSMVVTASWDKTARIWDARSGHPVTLPLKHNDWVMYAAFGPDGRRIVTAGRDRAARMWHERASERSVEHLTLLSEVYSGRRIHTAGGLEQLSSAELESQWR
jgi:WD40 repeat protein